jgi:hypothetical protein
LSHLRPGTIRVSTAVAVVMISQAYLLAILSEVNFWMVRREHIVGSSDNWTSCHSVRRQCVVRRKNKTIFGIA